MRFRMSMALLFVAATAAIQSTATAAAAEQACQPLPKLPKGEDFVVLAAGAYAGRPIDVQLDQSGHQATQIDVIVNTGVKPVVLMLGAYDPTVWNIKWTRDSYIVAIYASGYHRQVVVGVPKSLPVYTGYTEAHGPCPTFYITEGSNASLNPIARNLFGQPVAMVYPAKNGEVTIGEPVRNPSLLRTSRDTVVENFIDKNAPLAGEAGLADAVKRGILRVATQADADAWIAHQEQVSGPRDEPPVSGGWRRRTVSLYKAYVVLGAFTYPAGLYGGNAATFFIPQGTPRPTGNPGHSAVYDFNATLRADAGEHRRTPPRESFANPPGERVVLPSTTGASTLIVAPVVLPPGFKGLSASKIESRLVSEDPVGFLVYASELADAGKLDDAMLFHYVALIRLKFHEVAHPSKDQVSHQAALKIMQEKLQVPLTGYTRKDPIKSADLLSKAMDWDEQHDNTFVSKTQYADAYKQTRLAFEQFYGDLMMGARLIEEARKRQTAPEQPR